MIKKIKASGGRGLTFQTWTWVEDGSQDVMCMAQMDVLPDEVYLVTLESKFPGKGYGTRMLQEIVMYAKQTGRKLSLDVSPRDCRWTPRLVQWYLRHGFVQATESSRL